MSQNNFQQRSTAPLFYSNDFVSNESKQAASISVLNILENDPRAGIWKTMSRSWSWIRKHMIHSTVTYLISFTG